MSERIQEIIKELRSMQNAAQVVLDSGFGTHEGEHDTIYRKRRNLAKDAADIIERMNADMELLAGNDTSGIKCNICKHNPNDMGCELDGSQFDDDGECHFEWRYATEPKGEATT